MKPVFVAFFSFSFAVMIGSSWEIFEFAMDQLLGFNMQKSGLIDTMWDIIVNHTGALLISLLGYFYIIGRKKSYLFEHTITKFVNKNPNLFKKKNTIIIK